MPFLELIGEVREGADTYSAAVMSAMLFPREEEAEERRNWHAASIANSYSIWEKSGAPTEFLMPFHERLDDLWGPDELWKLPHSPVMIFKNGLGRSKRARYTGYTLAYLLRLAQHHPEHCRVEVAHALLREEFSRNDLKAPSESTLEKTWAAFKTVSHLWYARHIWHWRHKAQDVRNNVEDNADWRHLLSEAEGWRQLGERLRLLPPGEMWRTPEGFPLQPVSLEIAPLSPELLEFLNEQFPR